MIITLFKQSSLKNIYIDNISKPSLLIYPHFFLSNCPSFFEHSPQVFVPFASSSDLR